MKRLCKEVLSDKIQVLRKQFGYTQEELGQRTGINRQIIGRIEKGEFIPSIQQLESLADVLDFDISSLFADTEPMVRTAFRRNAEGWSKDDEVERLLEMMMASKQQILLRKAMTNE